MSAGAPEPKTPSTRATPIEIDALRAAFTKAKAEVDRIESELWHAQTNYTYEQERKSRP